MSFLSGNTVLMHVHVEAIVSEDCIIDDALLIPLARVELFEVELQPIAIGRWVCVGQLGVGPLGKQDLGDRAHCIRSL